jgi:hypothetical protein
MRPPARSLGLALLAVGVAMVVEAAFGIQTVGTELVIWSLAGLLAAAAQGARTGADDRPSPAAVIRRSRRPDPALGGRAPETITLSAQPAALAWGLALGAALSVLVYALMLYQVPATADTWLVLGSTGLAVIVWGGLGGAELELGGLAAALTGVLIAAAYTPPALPGPGGRSRRFAALGSSPPCGCWPSPVWLRSGCGRRRPVISAAWARRRCCYTHSSWCRAWPWSSPWVSSGCGPTSPSSPPWLPSTPPWPPAATRRGWTASSWPPTSSTIARWPSTASRTATRCCSGSATWPWARPPGGNLQAAALAFGKAQELVAEGGAAGPGDALPQGEPRKAAAALRPDAAVQQPAAGGQRRGKR